MKEYVATSLLLGFAMALIAQSNGINTTDTSPIDGIVPKKIIQEKPLLGYANVAESDIVWEKKVWRIIDTREKMNLPFAYPEKSFFSIINNAVLEGKLKAYSVENDKFSIALDIAQVKAMVNTTDTVTILQDDFTEEYKVVQNAIDDANVKQIRVKEVWFLDKNTSTVQVRILGIAPLIDEYDDLGNYKYTKPLYWVYYPDCRELLSHQLVFNFGGNDAAPTTWEDLLEQRLFSSYITKSSNIYDRRLEDYLTGVDMLLEGDKIKNEIFHFENDLWSY